MEGLTCNCTGLCECAEVYPDPRVEVRLETREPVRDEYEAARGILAQAAEYVAGPRSSYYGHPIDNHGRTAILFKAYLFARFGVELDITEEDVCWLNVQQKVARDMHVPSADGVIDVAGYAANVAEVRAERDRRAA